MHIKRIHIGGHHLFDLAAPEIRPASPIRTAFDRPPRTRALAAIGAEPLENADTDDVVRDVERGSRLEQARHGLSVRLYDFAVSIQPGGAETLKVHEIVPPTWDELSTGEQMIYTAMRGYFEAIFPRINEARAIVGRRPIKYRGDYFTFARVVESMANEGVDIVFASDRYVQGRIDTIFKYDIRKEGSKLPFERNALGIFTRYITASLKYIHRSPVLSAMRNMLDFAWVGEDGKPRGMIYDLAPMRMSG